MNTQLQDNVQWLLLQATMKTKQNLMKAAAEFDLNLLQALTLCYLEPDQSVAMNSISSMLSCDPSNVTGIVDKLVSINCISRTECATDRRIKTITLTEHGLDLRNRFYTAIMASSILSKLSATEQKSLKKLLQKIITVPSSIQANIA